MINRVFWLTRHALTETHKKVLREIHGDHIQFVHVSMDYDDEEMLADILSSLNEETIAYAVAQNIHFSIAAQRGLRFGYFQKMGKRHSEFNGIHDEFSAVYILDPSLPKGWAKVWPKDKTDRKNHDEGGE